MNCVLTTGFDRGCQDNQGGALEFYFGNYVSDFTVTPDPTGKITLIAGTGLEYWKYELEPETGFFNETFQENPQNGTNFVEQALTMVLNKMEQSKRNEIKLLAKSLMTVIVKDSNGTYWLFGEQNGIRMGTGGTGASGTVFGDRNGYSLNFIGKEPCEKTEVYLSAFSALIGSNP